MKMDSYSAVSVSGLLGLSLVAIACTQASETSSSGPSSATAKTKAADAGGSGDSVGAPECDEVLKKAASCKDKPGMSAILANQENWKRGLANAATKDATITACKAAMEAVKAVGCDAAATDSGGAGWDGKAPYTCTGNATMVVTGVTANIASGPAISADGNCKVTFKGCTISSNKGIVAEGNAQVTFDGGEIKASDTAIESNGNAQVTVTGAKVSGKVIATGNGKVTGVPMAK